MSLAAMSLAAMSQSPKTETDGWRNEVGLLQLALAATMAFLTVVDLFAAQALLPALTAAYGVSPSAMSLAVNACTLGMAAGGFAVAAWGHRLPFRQGISGSLLILALPTLLLALAPNIEIFAALRIIQGLAMSAAFGLTVGYLGQQYSGPSSAGIFAAYITGNVASNLIGRLIAAAVADHAGTSGAFLAFAALNLAGAALAFRTLTPRTPAVNLVSSPSQVMPSWRAPLQSRELRSAFAVGFCILFIFIGTFTFINFVLVRPPLSLSMMQVGLVYFVFLPSILTTPFAGRVSQRLGNRRSLWLSLAVVAAGLPLLFAPWLAFVLLGLVLVAVGTFAAQAIATGYVSRRAGSERGAASGIYLSCYFLGGLAGTAVLGQTFDHLGWNATVAGIGLVVAAAALLVRRLD